MTRKPWDKGGTSRHQQGYGTAWDKLRKAVLAPDNYLCQHCLAKGRPTVGKDGNNNPLSVPAMVSAVPTLTTTAASITETQGTASGVCSSIVLGDFTQMLIGMREDINIRVLDQPFADTGEIMIIVHARADIQLAHSESFYKLIGIKP
ncbi:MAG: phage major capsid protein [Pseudomonadota bacterium]